MKKLPTKPLRYFITKLVLKLEDKACAHIDYEADHLWRKAKKKLCAVCYNDSCSDKAY